jgi:hypothetical protein
LVSAAPGVSRTRARFSRGSSFLASATTAAQIWIASTGAVDPSGASTYLFNGQLAFVKPSLATGTVILRYNVLPL